MRSELFSAWLPDAYPNLHGYLAHGRVQQLSAYAALVRGRTVTQRSYWASREWFTSGFTCFDNPDRPEIREGHFAILDTSITSFPEIEAVNCQQCGRYAR